MDTDVEGPHTTTAVDIGIPLPASNSNKSVNGSNSSNNDSNDNRDNNIDHSNDAVAMSNTDTMNEVVAIPTSGHASNKDCVLVPVRKGAPPSSTHDQDHTSASASNDLGYENDNGDAGVGEAEGCEDEDVFY